MVNSASQALAEFKSQRLGGLLSGTSSTVSAPSIMGTSLSDSAADRMARSAPKRSSSAFMSGIRKSGQNYHQTALAGIQAKQERMRQQVLAQQGIGGPAKGGAQYRLPGGLSSNGRQGAGVPGGRYDGVRVDAANALGNLEARYRQAFGQNFIINDGWRSYEDQVKAWNRYQAGGPKAATPGTSLHGSGIAVDFGGPIQSTGSKQHAWLRQNAAQFGWYWVGQRYGEPWHWEYHPQGL